MQLSKCGLGALALAGLCAWCAPQVRADVANLKVVTDASPDYSDMESMVRSITGQWEKDADKMWALFYWNHIARRQTNPISVHGQALTDPIRQFNDYGFTMCSTISGINCSIWNYMGYPSKYYDIGLHTVPDVWYDGAYHHYDNSLSVIYTLCDGKTIASIEDVGKTLGCEASGGKKEPGHIAIYHSLNGTSTDGFLEGADTMRDLRHLGRDSFKPAILKYRYYFSDQERGHRYSLNLRDNEVYSRFYTRQDKDSSNAIEINPEKRKGYKADPAYFTPNGYKDDGTPIDPEVSNPRYRIRGNGTRSFAPVLDNAHLLGAVYSASNIKALSPGLQAADPANPGEAVFKVEGANVITSLKIVAAVTASEAQPDAAVLSISTDNGLNWKEVWRAAAGGENKADVKLIKEVNGAYDVLVKAALKGPAVLKSIQFDSITQVNAKTQPQLKLGKNTVYVGTGEQTGTIVVWPDLQGDAYKPYAVEAENIVTNAKHPGWHGVLRPGKADGEGSDLDAKGSGYVVFKADAPQDITRITQGARMYVRNKGAQVAFEHSFDGGKTWIKSYTFNDTAAPWDDIHHQVTENIPAGTRSVLFKYDLSNCQIYSVRMEVNHKLADSQFRPVEVTFNWSERQKDYNLVERSHTQLVDKVPFTYTINVGGYDHPIVNSLTTNLKGARGDVKYGYSDGEENKNAAKFVGNWVTYGKNLAEGKPYTVSVPSGTNWGAGDPKGTKLTDGRVGSSYSGGTSYQEGLIWSKGSNPEVVVDLGEAQKMSVFRIHIHGQPAQDGVKGQVKDQVEVLTSKDGQEYASAGNFDFNLYWKDIPVNYMWTDEETFNAHNYTLQTKQPVEARYVKFKITPSRTMDVTEVQVLDGMKSEPFDLKIALPDPQSNGKPAPAADLSPNARQWKPEELPKDIGQPRKRD